MPLLTEKARLAGLLVPAFALRREGDLGIGDTLAVQEAIDFCADAGFKVLQILPNHETVGDHSPYNPISARALSPALLSLTPGEVPGLTADMLSATALERWLAQLRTGPVKHKSVQPLKNQILLAAHARFCHEESGSSPLELEFEEFKKANDHWLKSYSLFRRLISQNEGNPNWTEWRPEHRSVSGAESWLAQHPSLNELSGLRDALSYIQRIAWRQWRRVRSMLMRVASSSWANCHSEWADAVRMCGRNLSSLIWIGTWGRGGLPRSRAGSPSDGRPSAAVRPRT